MLQYSRPPIEDLVYIILISTMNLKKYSHIYEQDAGVHSKQIALLVASPDQAPQVQKANARCATSGRGGECHRSALVLSASRKRREGFGWLNWLVPEYIHQVPLDFSEHWQFVASLGSIFVDPLRWSSRSIVSARSVLPYSQFSVLRGWLDPCPKNHAAYVSWRYGSSSLSSS